MKRFQFLYLFQVLASEELPEYLLGLFHDDHMDYHLKATNNQPTLEELVEAAIKILSRSSKGYFLFVEGKLDCWLGISGNYY